MRSLSSCFLFLLLTSILINAQAQRKKTKEPSGRASLLYTDHTYQPGIQSVSFSRTGKAYTAPVIRLNSSDELLLSFDDLGSGRRDLYYTIEHCSRDWQGSGLLSFDYLEGFEENRIEKYAYSENTLKPYTHYELSFPNDKLKPKLSGNYLLKVYSDQDPGRLLLSRRFYVLDDKVLISAKRNAPNEVSRRPTHQRLEVNVDCKGLNIQNPYTDILLSIQQNSRPDIARQYSRPTFISGEQLLYKELNMLDFPGGNEFRLLDLRSLRSRSESVASIIRDSLFSAVLYPDEPRGDRPYIFSYDDNGRFSIASQDSDRPETGADYLRCTFSIKGPQHERLYLLGAFTNYELSPENELSYDPLSGTHRLTRLLKQGVYNYEYASLKEGKSSRVSTEGNFYETRNNYNLFFYYHRPGSRYDELIGYLELKSDN